MQYEHNTKSLAQPSSKYDERRKTQGSHMGTLFLKYAALPEGLVELMIQLHSTCVSSASIERIFSSFGLIHNKIRNRLGVEKAAKLVFCYRMLRGKEDLDY